MSPTASDQIVAAALAVAHKYRTFTATDVQKVATEQFDDDAPARRAIYRRLNGLEKL